MSEVTVRQLASTVGVPLEKLMSQLSEAGLAVSGADDVLSNDEKLKLLGYLRGSQSTEGDVPETNKKVTLTRKSVSELKQSRVASGGRATKSVSVEVRKRRTYIKKSEMTEGNDELQEVENAQKELEQERQQAAAEETARSEKEALQIKEREAEEESKRLQTEQLLRQQETEKLEQERLEQERIVKEKATKEAVEQAAIASKKSKPAAPKTAAPAVEDKKDKPAARKKAPAKSARGSAGDSRKQLHVRDAGNKRKAKGSKNSRRTKVVRETEHAFEKPSQPVTHDVRIPETIVVSELAKRMSVKAAEVIKTLMGMGMMATINQVLDREDAALIVEEMGHNAILRDEDSLEQDVMASIADEEHTVQTRAPVVTIMGHVDHGKTSLLDYIRKTRVTAGEAGGITQHIGAYRVTNQHGSVAFLDTPGHAAFTAMRARGAEVTDIVVVVVAADDGVMPQTKEAIEHARAAKVPMIVAVNKMDKEGADADRVKNELSVMEVIPEDWGGDTQFVPVSALTGQGVDELLEALVLQAEILELTAPTTGRGSGFVIESRLDKGRGPVATVLVQKGVLTKGDIVLAGTEFGRVRAMMDEDGQSQATAGPSTPVEIIGLSGVPDAGVEFQVMPNERQARDVAENRSERERSSKMAEQQKAKLDNLFSHMESGEVLDLNLMIKTDVHGSLEALRESLVNLSTDEVRVNVIYGGIGGITESDANLAMASNAIIIGFNVRADAAARKVIDTKQIDLHYYSVIYDVIDEVKRSINGLLGPDIKEQIVGVAEVRDVFKSPKLGAIAGCMVMEGKVVRNLPIRVLRDNVVIYEGQLESLRRFKDDATEVKAGVECGIGVKNYNDVKAGDQIEAYERVEVERTLS